jgi:DNA-binding response OmpR family regulator
MVRDKEANLLFALAVDNNPVLLPKVRQCLAPCDLQFDHALSVRQAEDLLSRRFYCLLLIRLETAPKSEILQFCAQFRLRNPHAVLLVMADALEAALEESLFDHGANDVVNARQSSAAALAKRIRAHLHTLSLVQSCPQRVRLGDSLVDFDRREVLRARTIYRLPGILADLLRYFVENADHVVSREELQQSPIWLDSVCTPATQGGKTFDVNIGKLRKIIESDPHKPRIIVSVRGVGWKLTSELLQHESAPVARR